jgi:hypothetical protein
MTLWAPVVYGRTPTSDTWWRAVPEGLNQHGWLSTVVHSALGAGGELKQRPRFLFAQDEKHRIVGVACQASDLSDTMRSIGSRDLFCFIGWVASRTGRSGPIAPEFEELERSYRDWAAPVYARILAEPWHAPPTAYSPPVTTRPERPVWPPPARQPEPGETPEKGPWAEQAWPSIWAAAQAAREPLTCVIGWQWMNSARFENATHIGVADAAPRSLPEVQYAEQSVTPEPEPEPQPVPARPIPLRQIEPEPVLTELEPLTLISMPATASGATSSAGRSRQKRGPTWPWLAVAAAAGAAVAGVLVGILSSGPAPAPAQTAATGPPTILEVVIPASAQPPADSLVQYAAGELSPGQSAAHMAVWPGGTAASPGACANTVATAPLTAPVPPHSGLWLCVELTGSPAQYGLVDVTQVTKAAVTTTTTLWP